MTRVMIQAKMAQDLQRNLLPRMHNGADTNDAVSKYFEAALIWVGNRRPRARERAD